MTPLPHAAAFMRLAAVLCIILTSLAAPPTWGLINPTFTPVDLVRRSDCVARIELGPLTGRDVVPLRVTELHQGAAPGITELALDAGDGDFMRELRGVLGDQRVPALLFAGDYSAASAKEAGDFDQQPVGAVLVGNTWFGLSREGDRLRLNADPLELKTVWAGGDASLALAVRYILADPRADVPTHAGPPWASSVLAASPGDSAQRLLAIDLAPAGQPAKPCLHVLASQGDRLYALTPGATPLTDLTESLGLTSRSRLAAWGDFNGDGRWDLASVDDHALTLHLADSEGRFSPAPAAAVPLADRGVAITVLAGATPGRSALALVTRDRLLLVTFGDDLKPTIIPLPRLPDSPPPSACVAADFDADGRTDLACADGQGVVLYRGADAASFAPPVRIASMELNGAVAALLPADFDADGRLDLAIVGDMGTVVLDNRGADGWGSGMAGSGELPYNAKPEANGASITDLNADGRTDLAIAYRGMLPQFYFNRGFRCFGYAVGLEPRSDTLDATATLRAGQRDLIMMPVTAASAADALVLDRDGKLWLLRRKEAAAPTPTLTVALPPGIAGPVSVVAHDGVRCLGARVAAPGQPARFAKPAKGPLVLTWRTADGVEHTRKVIVLGPTRTTLSDVGP